MNVGSASWLLGQLPPISVTEPVVIRLRLIGRMEAWTLNSESVLPIGRKTRALLAMVALAAPRTVSRIRLAETLWSRRPEEQARASLRQEIHRLLDALQPAGAEVLAINRDNLSLRPGAVWIDVDEVARATAANPAALSLLDGELLEDLDGIDGVLDSWLAAERERLRDRARAVAETVLREQVTPETAIPAAKQLLAIDRTHEGGWRALMRAHAALGEGGMAVEAFERCRATLADLRGAVPSEKTQRLVAQLRAGAFARGIAPDEGFAVDPPDPDPIAMPSGPAMVPSVSQTVTTLLAPIQVAAAADGLSAVIAELDVVSDRAARHNAPRGGARLGVLPLRLAGIAEDEAHLALGLADEITTGLSRFRWMFLVSSASLAHFAAHSRDETEIRRAFGLDFLLDGTIQRERERLRINVRLVDLRAGNLVVWSRRFERETRDLLNLQDEIAAEVVAQVDPEILLIEAQRVTVSQAMMPAGQRAADASAYDLMLRAIPLINRLDRPQFMQAGELLLKAISLDPEYAAPHAWFAYWHIFLVAQAWSDNPRMAISRAGQLAERAVQLDPHDARALTIAGHVRAFLDRRLREALVLHDRALMLNPNLAMAWSLSGLAYVYLGDTEEAERRLARYKKLSPMDPQAYFFDVGLVMSALLQRDYESAVVIGRAVAEMNPFQAEAFKPYLSALGHLREAGESAVVLRRLLSVEPDFTVQRFLESSPFERDQDREHFAAGLRLAGLPEGAALI